jgi:8-amino-7-oxononanoate synthase
MLTGIDEGLRDLASAGRLRDLRVAAGPLGRTIELSGQTVLNFSSNNYLGLAEHDSLRQAMVAAAGTGPIGAAASRLITGNRAEHEALESTLADWQQYEAALLFNSGYQANIGVLQALLDRESVVFSDELNHASIIDGCRLSRARVVVYAHKETRQLRTALENAPESKKLIVTDGLFSMDGDIAPVAELAALAEEFEAALVVDEAHAVGVRGPMGRGVCAEAGIKPDVLVGTLGKAFGSFGAFVATTLQARRLLLNRARSFVFSTALPGPVCAASIAATKLIAGSEGLKRRESLAARASELAEGLRTLGLHPAGAPSQILPILIGQETRTMEASAALLSRGIFAQGIRPPTVPRGTSRLRVALMADHTPEDIRKLLAALGELGLT